MMWLWMLACGGATFSTHVDGTLLLRDLDSETLCELQSEAVRVQSERLSLQDICQIQAVALGQAQAQVGQSGYSDACTQALDQCLELVGTSNVSGTTGDVCFGGEITLDVDDSCEADVDEFTRCTNANLDFLEDVATATCDSPYSTGPLTGVDPSCVDFLICTPRATFE